MILAQALSDGQFIALLLGWLASLAGVIAAFIVREQKARDRCAEEVDELNAYIRTLTEKLNTVISELHEKRLLDARELLDRYHEMLKGTSSTLADLVERSR